MSEELRWLQQADRARRLATTLPQADARVLEAFAMECETKAQLASQPALRAA
jgi:hypothetical protein